MHAAEEHVGEDRIAVAKSTVEKYQVHPRRPASPSWRALPENQLHHEYDWEKLAA